MRAAAILLALALATPAATSAQTAAWATYAYPDLRMKADFPVAPPRADATQKTESGASFPTTTLGVDTPGQSYVIVAADYSPAMNGRVDAETEARVLQGMVKGTVGEGEILSQQAIDGQGGVAREVVARAPSMVMIFRAYFVQPYAYVVMVGRSAGSAPDALRNPDTARFFAGFQPTR